DPDVRRLGVGCEIDVDHAEDHPLAVGRDLRIADALQLHHVFKGEGMFGLGRGERCQCGKHEKIKKNTAHEASLLRRTAWQTKKCSRVCNATALLRLPRIAQ